MRSIQIDPFNPKSIQVAIKALDREKKRIERKTDELTRYLAELGAIRASYNFSHAMYVGDNDVELSVRKIKNGYSIVANGEDVCFIEFGSGAKYGYGHPKANTEDGHTFGPGTWSLSEQGKGQWDNPKGWFFTKNGETHHSYGNPPAMAMFNAELDIRAVNILQIAERVFND